MLVCGLWCVLSFDFSFAFRYRLVVHCLVCLCYNGCLLLCLFVFGLPLLDLGWFGFCVGFW